MVIFNVFLRDRLYYSKKARLMELDALDFSILKNLQKDGRMSNAALADAVGLSQSACSRRLDILEKSGVINGYHAQISNAALGHSVTVIVHMSLSGQSEKTLAEFAQAPENANSMSRFLKGMKQSDFAFAGVVENMDEDIKILAKQYDWQAQTMPSTNESKSSMQQVSDDDLQKIIAANREDIEWYNHIVQSRKLNEQLLIKP